jgi:hypothetical protein
VLPALPIIKLAAVFNNNVVLGVPALILFIGTPL